MITQKQAQEVYDAIKVVPGKGLGEHWYYGMTSGLYCSLGAVLLARGANVNYPPDVDNIFPSDVYTTIARENDGFEGTPLQRKEHMLAWCVEQGAVAK